MYMYRDRIKEAKQRLGITAKAMAMQTTLHIQEETVSRFLSGKTTDPGVNTTLDIAATVGLKPYELFMDEGTAAKFAAFLELESKSDETEAERIRLVAEVDSLRVTNATLAQEVELLRLKLAHCQELIEDKNKIISLYERLEEK